MMSKWVSLVWKAFPETSLKNYLRGFIHRRRYSEYQTYYKNGVWELRYPEFTIRYTEVPSPARVNYLFFQKFTNRKFDIIIDAGGFMGTYGFLMAKKYPEAKVYIFEADPMNVARLEKNLALNDLKNVILEPIGLWHKPDVLKMSIGSDLASSIVNEKSATTVNVVVTSIDEYFKDVSSKLVFIKMNIEGAEISALHGAEKFIKNNKVDLNICTDHMVDGELTYKKVEKIFKEMEMPSETLTTDHFINTISSNLQNTNP